MPTAALLLIEDSGVYFLWGHHDMSDCLSIIENTVYGYSAA